MKVMTLHNWFDADIGSVIFDGHPDNREIVLKPSVQGALIVNKNDAIALAKEFNLVVYEEDSNL